MAGPTARLLLRSSLTVEQLEMVKRTIATIRRGKNAPFGFGLENSSSFEDESSLDEIASLIGYRPVQDLELYSMRNQDIDHRILGESICYLAEQLECYIDFGGAIFPLEVLPEKNRQNFDFVKTDWSEVAPYLEDMARDIKGKVFTLEYLTANNKKWASHICDVEFMTNWLLSPHFHMIK